MVERAQDWFRRAEADLRHARNAPDDADFEWSAFASHQALEKAIKAVFQKVHLDAWDQALSLLMAELPANAGVDESLLDRAKELDKH